MTISVCAHCHDERCAYPARKKLIVKGPAKRQIDVLSWMAIAAAVAVCWVVAMIGAWH